MQNRAFNLLWLVAIIGLNLALLLFSISSLSISYDEVKIFFLGDTLLHKIINLSTTYFGQNDYALRLPFLIAHFFNIILLYKISNLYLKRYTDRLICVVLYMFLPGVLASAILVNEASFIILITLLIIYFEQKSLPILMIVCIVLSFFISQSFVSLYIGLALFGLYKKQKLSLATGIIAAVVWFWLFGLETDGKPKGYLIDTLGVFAAVFSPLVFLYFIYTTYRIWIKEDKNLLWFISTTAFCVCSLLSIRQKQSLEMFLPFCVILTPLMVKVFFNSYRVRLPKFRIKHKICAIIVLSFLAVNSFASIFHSVIYLFLDDPKKHFVYKYDVAKDLANRLKLLEIHAAKTNYDMAIRLQFYGIKKGNEYILSQKRQDGCDNSLIKITKFDKVIARYYICKSQ
ncbi:putative membrane protein [Campylobacter iguaniorum]|uniref:hypothetical protein n=1 Tax=Campylobacter iguaniorum TaxID=1244531 RepID=UPI0007C8830B|nr:hypothetical protein [Campylobacter iguaniorum]ANE35629.1 putative membrane protein [Campylobacter iguaniorum]